MVIADGWGHDRGESAAAPDGSGTPPPSRSFKRGLPRARVSPGVPWLPSCIYARVCVRARAGARARYLEAVPPPLDAAAVLLDQVLHRRPHLLPQPSQPVTTPDTSHPTPPPPPPPRHQGGRRAPMGRVDLKLGRSNGVWSLGVWGHRSLVSRSLGSPHPAPPPTYNFPGVGSPPLPPYSTKSTGGWADGAGWGGVG